MTSTYLACYGAAGRENVSWKSTPAKYSITFWSLNVFNIVNAFILCVLSGVFVSNRQVQEINLVTDKIILSASN